VKKNNNYLLGTINQETKQNQPNFFPQNVPHFIFCFSERKLEPLLSERISEWGADAKKLLSYFGPPYSPKYYSR